MHAQTIFITGIHTGLGNALTQAFLNNGAEVFAVSRRRPDNLHNPARLRFRALDLSLKYPTGSYVDIRDM